MRVGSLCTGYGGLELALREVFDEVTLCWIADSDIGVSKILACRFPGVPNLGDITKINYSRVSPVDVLTAGFPCTDVSSAGRREGLTKDTRTGLWYEVRRAIEELHPPRIFLENVDGLFSGKADSDMESCPGCMGDRSGQSLLRAFGRVLGDLSSVGYDADWTCVPASGTGAPHRRRRVFIWASGNAQCKGLEGSDRLEGAEMLAERYLVAA